MSDVQNGQVAPEGKTVVLSEVAKMIDDGVPRSEIAKKYGIPFSEMKAQVFNLPELRGRKPKKQFNSLKVVNDLATQEAVEVVPVQESEGTEESPEETASQDDDQQDAGDQNVTSEASSQKPAGWSRSGNQG